MELPAGLADVDLMCFDVDGTLAAADHHPTPRTLRALAALVESGVRVVVITGRALPQAQMVFREAGIDGVSIAANGAVTAEGTSGRVLRRTTLPAAEVDAVLDFVAGRELEAVLFTEGSHLVKHGSVIAQMFREINPEVPTLEVDLAQVPREEVIKASITSWEHVLDTLLPEIRAAFPRIVRSMSTIVDLSPDGADKGASLLAHLADLGIDPADVTGVGDSENDLSWLSRIGHPVAVSNAVPAVKELAVLEIGHHDEEAVAELVEAVVAARTSSH